MLVGDFLLVNIKNRSTAASLLLYRASTDKKCLIQWPERNHDTLIMYRLWPWCLT